MDTDEKTTVHILARIVKFYPYGFGVHPWFNDLGFHPKVLYASDVL